LLESGAENGGSVGGGILGLGRSGGGINGFAGSGVDEFMAKTDSPGMRKIEEI